MGDAIINIIQKTFLPDEDWAVIYQGDAISSCISWYEKIPIVSTISKVTADFIYGEGTWDETVDSANNYKIYGMGQIKFGPATIFTGKISLFNINFIFNTENDYKYEPYTTTVVDTGTDTEFTTSELIEKLESYGYDGSAPKSEVRVMDDTFWETVEANDLTNGDHSALDEKTTEWAQDLKIVLSSTSSQDKAKYKVMLKDWIVGFALIFVLHYIMMGILVISDKIVEIFNGSLVTEQGIDVLFSTIRNNVSQATSLLKIGFTIMYFVMIFYTVMFAIQYLKRLIYVIFLTIIAPFVALTYPIDKLRDGKAQAFNMWFKEYLYNSLIQVLHIILYYVLIESAIELAVTNILYSFVAMGFMLEAEKILKVMFGFNAKGGMFGGRENPVLAGALAMGAINKIGGIKTSRKEGSNKISTNNESIKLRTNDSGKNIKTQKDLNSLEESLMKRAKSEKERIKFKNVIDGIRNVNDMI